MTRFYHMFDVVLWPLGGTDTRWRAVAAIILGAFVIGLPPAPAVAESRRVPRSAQEIELSFSRVVKRVAPAVVNIYAKRVVAQRRMPFLNDPFFRRFFGKDFPGFGQRERIQRSLGSGVILRSNGIIVTNHHVIAGAQVITAVLSDRREFTAKVILSDKRTDLAVLRIDTKGERLPTVPLGNSDDLEVGDLVLAVGNPFGVGQTVTSGIVSALARTSVGISDFSSFIQTDAAVNPGNSGGALVTTSGRLAGINTAIYSRSGGSIGIGFAIPANMVAAVLKAALSGGRLVRPWLGASGQNVSAEIAASLGLKRVGGVILNAVEPRGPAAEAGLRTGDIIIAVNGREVIDGEGLRFRIATLATGGEAEIAYIRGGQRRTTKVKLTPPPERPPRTVTQLRGDHLLSGATVANLSPALAEEIGVAHIYSGVIILKIARNSPAARVRFARHDILVSINGRKVTGVRALQRLLAGRTRTWRVVMRRAGRLINVTIRG